MPAGSFVINPRLQRLFMTLAVTFPGQDSLLQIYGTFLGGHLARFSEDVKVWGWGCGCLGLQDLGWDGLEWVRW
jgi:hypothetical protein